MAKFILLYKGPATEPADMPEEKRNAIMSKWGEWMQKTGSSIVDIGAPMNQKGASVVDNGSEGQAEELSGYTIVEANDLNAAKALCEGHPFLSDKTGSFSIEIYQLLPVPEM